MRFSGLILENIFMVFLGSSCRETAKNAIKKNRWEKTTGKKFFFLNFFRPKVFDMYFPKKVFYGVFELPLLRNAQKRHKKNLKIKKKRGKRYLPTPFSGHLPDIRGFQFYFSWAPLGPYHIIHNIAFWPPWESLFAQLLC